MFPEDIIELGGIVFSLLLKGVEYSMCNAETVYKTATQKVAEKSLHLQNSFKISA